MDCRNFRSTFGLAEFTRKVENLADLRLTGRPTEFVTKNTAEAERRQKLVKHKKRYMDDLSCDKLKDILNIYVCGFAIVMKSS